MKRFFSYLILLACSQLIGASCVARTQSAAIVEACSPAPAPVNIGDGCSRWGDVLYLTDGSRLQGCLLNSTLKVHSPILGSLAIASASVSTIARDKEGPFVLTLANGDRINCSFSQGEIRFQTLFGIVAVSPTSLFRFELAATEVAVPEALPKQLVPRASRPDMGIGVTVALADGSLIIGKVDNEAIGLATDFARLTLPVRQVARLRMSSNEAGTVETVKGDILHGAVTPPTIIRTAWAEIELSPYLLRQVEFQQLDAIVERLAETQVHAFDQVVSLAGRQTHDLTAALKDLSRKQHTLSIWCRPSLASLDARSVIFSNWHRETLRLDEGLPVFALSMGREGQNNSEASVGLRGKQRLSEGVWAHLAVVFDSGNVASLYVNGALVDEKKVPAKACAWYRRGFQLGATVDLGGAHDYFSGQLTNLRIYNKALSSLEISALHQQHPAMLLPEQ